MQPNATAAQSARSAALAALDADQKRKLALFAKACSRGLPEDGDDLLQSAYARWLSSEEPIGDAEQTYDYLIGALNSLRFNAHRHGRAEKRTFGQRLEPASNEVADPRDAVPSSAPSAEDSTLAHQLYELMAGDEEMQMLLLHQSERTPRADIQKETGWDDRKYETVQKRKIRAVAKFKLQGKI